MSIPLYNVQGVEFRYNQMVLKIDGKELIFNLPEVSKRLAKASKIEREKYEISPSGYGIHWPLIDEDLSVPGLLKTASSSSKRGEEINSLAV
jgi:hypothetical protein